MLNIEVIDSTVEAVCNKKLSGAVGPDDRNRFYNLVNLDILKLKAGLPEDYQPGRAIPNQGSQLTFKLSDDIAFLLKEVDISKASNGFFPMPTDYAAYDYAMFAYIDNACKDTTLLYKNIEPVTGAERAIRMDSHLIPPTMEQPIISWNSLGWRVDPDKLKQIRLNYLRLPATPFRAYTMNGDQDVYNPTGSVNAEWPQTMFGDFVIRVCKYFGINLLENELVQFSQDRQLRGQ